MVPFPKARRGVGRAVPMLDADSLAMGNTENSPDSLANHHLNSPVVEPPQSSAASGESGSMQFEQAFVETKVFISQASRQVLATVLHSLLDDYRDSLLGPISARLEVATARASLPSPMNSASVPLGNTARTPHRVSPRPSNTSTPSHRKGGRLHKNKEEEQEMCSVHHCMRAIKHLQNNSVTRSLECIHGFHCLVDTPATSPQKGSAHTNTPTPTVTPTRANRFSKDDIAAVVTSPAAMKFAKNQQFQQQQHQQQQLQQQYQRLQQTEQLLLQQEHLQQFHGFTMPQRPDPLVFQSVGTVPFTALPSMPTGGHTDPIHMLTREISPEDDYPVDNKVLTDFVNSLGDGD